MCHARPAGHEQQSTGLLHLIVRIRPQYKKSNTKRCWTFCGGGRWIRTTEGIASRFTVCPLWPLGNSPIFFFCRSGAGGRTRTPDLLITNQLLYRLSYTSISTGSIIIPNQYTFVNNYFYFLDKKLIWSVPCCRNCIIIPDMV